MPQLPYCVVVAVFCYGNEASDRHACMNGHLPTANQSEIREAYLNFVMATPVAEHILSVEETLDGSICSKRTV